MSKLTWNPDKDPEWEDREAFLKLSSTERWRYLMRLIMQTKKLPKGAGQFSKRRIEWNPHQSFDYNEKKCETS